MNKLVYVIFLLMALLCPILSLAQTINHQPFENPPTETSFYPSYIIQNKISSITVTTANKPDNQVIDDKEYIQHYKFDSLGKVTQYYYTILAGMTTREVKVPPTYRKGRQIRKGYTRYEKAYAYDTLFTSFYYDTLSRLIIKRSRNNNSYNATYYTYDANGRIVKEVRCKETNEGTPDDFRLGMQTVNSIETFEYEKNSNTQLKKKCFNDEARVYKNVIINFDTRGNKTEEYSEYVVTWMSSTSTWKYNEKSHVTEHTYASNATGNVKQVWKFEYDAKENIIAEKRFKNDVQTNEISYLYDEKGEILKSQVNRDFPQKSIAIIKYSYEYRK